MHDYDSDGKIFANDIGSVIRSVKGLKPLESQVNAIKEQVREGDIRNKLNEEFYFGLFSLIHMLKAVSTHGREIAQDILT